jgi:hypothetical protein
MARQLPKELYIDPRPGGPDVVERICAHATNRPAEDVVAVAVSPINVAQASDLLFGTGIGVVSSIDVRTRDLIDQARRSVAEGATEIALPRLELNQVAVLTRLRARLGPFIPVTIRLTETNGAIDMAAAEEALRLGADYVSFSANAASTTISQDVLALLALADDLKLGGVKITATTGNQASSLKLETSTRARAATRLCVPISLAGG